MLIFNYLEGIVLYLLINRFVIAYCLCYESFIIHCRYLESQHGSEAAAIVATIPETIKTLQKVRISNIIESYENVMFQVSENAVGLFMGKVKRNEIEVGIHFSVQMFNQGFLNIFNYFS